MAQTEKSRLNWLGQACGKSPVLTIYQQFLTETRITLVEALFFCSLTMQPLHKPTLNSQHSLGNPGRYTGDQTWSDPGEWTQ